MTQQEPQSEVFFDPQGVDVPTSRASEPPHIATPEYSTQRFAKRFRIAKWRDPLTVPRSKTDCVKWCQITPWDKWCCGTRTRWSYMDCELYVTISAPDGSDIQKAVAECMREAAVAAALAAIIAAVATGGAALAAAVNAFKTVFTACLANKLKNALFYWEQPCAWSDWE